MKIVQSKATDKTITPTLRECWVVTAGTSLAHIDPKRTKTWQITTKEPMGAEEYERLNQEIREYANELKGHVRVHWVRVEWTGFDPLRLDKK
jgi:hypothetical protein